MRLRGALYARQSEDRRGDLLAIDRQMPRLEAMAKRRDVDILFRFIDNDISAKGHKKRPDFEKMMRAADAKQFDVIIAPDWYRLSRNRRESLRIFEIGEARGLQIWLDKGVDLNLGTPGGRLVAGMNAEVARNEIDVKAERQKDANLQRAERGQMGWTRRPFGYDRADGKIRTVPAEAKLLRATARRVLAGTTLAEAVRVLNAAGSSSTVGKPWNVTSLKRALLNPRYCGRVTYNGVDIAAGSWPVILKPDLQEQLRIKLTDPGRLLHNGIGVKYLLSGICLCGKCGKRMFATSVTNGERMVYRCMPSGHLQRGMDDVDAIVEETILQRLERPDAASLLLPDVDVDRLRAEVSDLRQRRDAIVRMIADGLTSPAEGRAQAEKLTGELQGLDGMLAAALGDSPLTPFTAESAEARAIWAELDLTQQRAVIRELTEVRIMPQGKGASFDPDAVVVSWIG